MLPTVKTRTRGVIIGKFHPPHRGHSHLISTALQMCDWLDILVCQRRDQNIPGELRAQWLREMHPQAHVIVVDDPGVGSDSAYWAEQTVRILGRKPHVVFSSEIYGERYAELMGAKHVMVDAERTSIPISATEIRANPMRHWHYLPAPVRAHYALRVCIVGAETSGTSVMSRLLADHYNTVWVPGYGREYSESRIVAQGGNAPWRSEEFMYIAQRQHFYEDVIARNANKLVLCDSDALAICLWHERYMKTWSDELDELAQTRDYAHYFLTANTLPHIADPEREWMTQRFKDELARLNRNFTVLEGTVEERIHVATAILDGLLKAK